MGLFSKKSNGSNTNTLIIGAGPAGLAMAACLAKQKTPYTLLEQTDKVAVKWHQHYNRLHLHTAKEYSALPYMAFPKQFPRYPSRQQVVRYLEDYAKAFDIQPEFNTQVVSACKTGKGKKSGWKIVAQTEGGEKIYTAKNLVVATGYNNEPFSPTWDGFEEFQENGGVVMHSADYKDGLAFKDKTVMVVGFGNSGAEIALDLWEYGAKPVMSVRSPVNVLPKEVFGIPTLALGIVQQHLPTKLSDRVSKITARTMMGDLSAYGLQTLDRGPMEEIKAKGRVPMLDVGTIDLVKRGEVVVYPDISHFTKDGAVFLDGREVKLDAVVLATGYRPKVDGFLDADGCLEHGNPTTSGAKSGEEGLYFLGFYISPAGMFREMAAEAKKVAKFIKKG